MSAWADLETRLRFQYPNDWPQRLQSYKDGTNPDLRKWRSIGGDRYDPAAKPERNGKRGPKRGFKFVPDPRMVARNRRIQGAVAAGVPLDALIDRFGLARSSILRAVSSTDDGASR